jgi:hypothetical protein
MFALAAISPGLSLRASSEVPRTLSPNTDSIATVAFLVIGLLLVAGTIRTVCKRE